MRIRIEKAESADDVRVAAIENRLFPREPLEPRQVAYYRRRKEALVLVARADGDAIAGYVVAALDRRGGRSSLWIVTMAVQPRARRRGLGRTLLRRAIAFGRAHGASLVKLQVGAWNRSARSLYESCGLAVVRRLPHYYEAGRHAYLMERRLGAPVSGE